MKAYINSSKAITPQKSFSHAFLWDQIIPSARRMAAIEPNYKDYFPALKLRRMSKIVKMGLISATECLKESGIEQPGAIITATGWGCLTDTFKFLDEIAEKKEQALSPATFIQSTHNTVGGQIALMLGCQEYNSVYVNHSTSFEHSLIDSLLLLKENKRNVLVGGVDEINDTDFLLKEKMEFWKKENDISFLPECETPGTIAGEGSLFFLLNSEQYENCISHIADVQVESYTDGGSTLKNLLDRHNLKESDIQVCISGLNGDYALNQIYNGFLSENLKSSVNCYYKHLCGQFDTASAFALLLAEDIIRNQFIPDVVKINKSEKQNSDIENILIYHYSEPNDHAFILVSKAGI